MYRRGYRAAQTFCAVMDLPPPPRFDRYNKIILDCLEEVSNTSMKDAVQEGVNMNDGNICITAALDASWQKRGHSSLNGVVTATSLDNGKVIDVECITKYCHGCNTGGENHKCVLNYEGYSGGMESEGVVKIFQRSEEKYGVKYTHYLGDGDSKGYQKACNNVAIEKMECVGHVQKRLGTRLRRLKKDYKGKKLADGKCLGGRGRLTDDEIDRLQYYYGQAIRQNKNNLPAMRKAVWATFFHKSSTDEKPSHSLCPPGSDSWCGYQRAVTEGKTYNHKHSLPYHVMEIMKPIYRDLSDSRLLEKCLHGRTQNPNESFNNCIWERIPKTVLVGLDTLKIGVLDSVICFNDGTASRCKVLKLMGVNGGVNMERALVAIDNRRVAEAEKAVLEGTKEARLRRRAQKRKRDDQEQENQDEYGPGMH